MELFLFRHAEYERLYNCSGIDIDKIPIEHRHFVPESITLISLSTIYYILYIPCLMSIWKQLYENTCYKLLFFIGIADISMLWIIGFLHGWLSLTNSVFCSHPTLIYFAGLAAYSGWIIESTADLVLAIERCVEIIAPDLASTLFHGRRLWFWIGGCCFYGILALFFETPVVFNGIYFAWFFNPFAGYREDVTGTFKNIYHAIHDISIAISMPLIYLTFAIALSVRWSQGQNHMSRTQIMAFLQVFIFSAMNTFGCFMYVIMQFVEVRQWMITLAQFNWMHIHGFPPVVYLLLNQTIRFDVIKMFFKIFVPKRIGKLHGITVLISGATTTLAQVAPSGVPAV